MVVDGLDSSIEYDLRGKPLLVGDIYFIASVVAMSCPRLGLSSTNTGEVDNREPGDGLEAGGA